MIAREALERLAHQDCLEHAKGVVSGELIVDLLEEDLEWDPIAARVRPADGDLAALRRVPSDPG